MAPARTERALCAGSDTFQFASSDLGIAIVGRTDFVLVALVTVHVFLDGANFHPVVPLDALELLVAPAIAVPRAGTQSPGRFGCNPFHVALIGIAIAIVRLAFVVVPAFVEVGLELASAHLVLLDSIAAVFTALIVCPTKTADRTRMGVL